jgi:PAS domain S-box-containing protein
MPLPRSRRPGFVATPLRSALEEAAHVCSIYDTPEESLDVVREFVEVGLGRGEKCLCLVSRGSENSFPETLRAASAQIDRALEVRAVDVATIEGAYLTSKERFTQHVLGFWRAAVDEALAAGFSGLRGIIQVDRALGGTALLAHWIDYESRLTQSGGTMLCLFNRLAHPAEFVREVLRAHALVAHRGMVGENTFHVPPAEYDAPDRAAREVDRMLTRLSDDWGREAMSLTRELRQHERQEQQLKRRMDYLTLGQTLTRTGSWAWNPSTGEMFWSSEHCRIFGVCPFGTDVSYDLFFRLVHPEERAHVEREFLDTIRTGGDFDLEYRIVCPDGTVKCVHCRAHPVFGASGEVTEYVGTVADITERRHGEESLSSMQSELARVSRVITLGQLMASIAHEVNQPLAALIANAGAGLRWLAGDNPRVDQAKQALTRIVRDGNRASEVIAHIRALVRRADAERISLDLNGVIEEVIALLKTELRRNKIVVRTGLAVNLPSVWGDRVQLQQVLLNLIMNAIEAMGAMVSRMRLLSIATMSDSGGVSVSIEDRGVGLDQQALERIFEPFFTTKPEGMGIGLAISRSIVETHGGLLWATRNRGPGATFKLRLPTARTDAQ